MQRNSAIHVRDGDDIDYAGHAAHRQLQGMASVIGNPTVETDALGGIVSATLKKGMQLTSENSGVMTKNRDTIVQEALSEPTGEVLDSSLLPNPNSP